MEQCRVPWTVNTGSLFPLLLWHLLWILFVCMFVFTVFYIMTEVSCNLKVGLIRIPLTTKYDNGFLRHLLVLFYIWSICSDCRPLVQYIMSVLTTCFKYSLYILNIHLLLDAHIVKVFSHSVASFFTQVFLQLFRSFLVSGNLTGQLFSIPGQIALTSESPYPQQYHFGYNLCFLLADAMFQFTHLGLWVIWSEFQYKGIGLYLILWFSCNHFSPPINPYYNTHSSYYI